VTDIHDLDEILNLHQLWLADDPTGCRANLYGMDLSGVDLYGVNLSRAGLTWANLYEATMPEGW